MSLRQDKSGVILIVVLGILALLCLVGVALVTSSRVESDAARSYTHGIQARLVCEAGLQQVIRDLTNDVNPALAAFAGAPESFLSEDHAKYDMYGDEPWFFSTGSVNKCRGGTVVSAAGNDLNEYGTVFPDNVVWLVVQPNTNKRQSLSIASYTASRLTTYPVRSETAQTLAGTGDDYRVLGGYRLSDGDALAADADGDGSYDSKWISYGIGSERYKARFAVHIEDHTAKVNVNMAGNLADTTGAVTPHHRYGTGFDSFDISLERLIQAAYPTGSEPTDAVAQGYAKAIIQARGGSLAGYGLGDAGTLPKTGTATTISGSWCSAAAWTPPVENGYSMFLGRSDYTVSLGTNVAISDNAAGSICFMPAMSGGYTVSQIANTGFNPDDIAAMVAGGGTPFDELDQMEMRSPSDHDSRLEQAINNAAVFDMVRNQLTTYSPEKLAFCWGQNYWNSGGSSWVAKPNINDSATTAVSIAAALGAAGEAEAAQVTAMILDWVDDDNDIEAYGGEYGVEAHLVITELYWEDIDNSDTPTATDGFAVELYNPFHRPIDLSLYRINTVDLPAGTVNPGDDYVVSNGLCGGAGLTLNGVVATLTFANGAALGDLTLSRETNAGSGTYVPVDRAQIAEYAANLNALAPGGAGSVKREQPFVDAYTVLGAQDLGTFVTSATGPIDIKVQDRAFASLGELFELVDPTLVGAGDLVYTDGDGGGIDDLHYVPSADVFSYLAVHDPGQWDARWKGRVNINTASRAAIMALPCMEPYRLPGVTSVGPRIIADSIIRGRSVQRTADDGGGNRRGYSGLEDLFEYLSNGGTWNRASTDGYDNNGDGGEGSENVGDVAYPSGNGATNDDDGDGIISERAEGLSAFMRNIANCITFSSDVYEVTILAEVMDQQKGVSLGRARLRVVVDRSTIDPATGEGVRIISKRWE